MTSIPDRPHALLSDAQLSARIHQCGLDQATVAKDRSAAAKRVLAQLKRTMAELIDERNAREDFDQNFPVPEIDTQPAILEQASMVHDDGVSVCSVVNTK